MEIFHPIYLSFYLVVILSIVAGVFMVLRGYFGKKGGFPQVLIFLLLIFGWLTLSAYLPNYLEINSFNDFVLFSALGLGIPICILLILMLLSLKTVDLLPPKWLTFFQVLRVLIELSFYGLFIRGLLPEKMTFTGMNGDLLIGLFSPVIAMYHYSNHSWGKFYAYLFHIAGIISLVWICFLGFYPPGAEEQGTFSLENPTWFEYPWIWHWTYLVPLFLFGHIISLYHLIKNPRIES